MYNISMNETILNRLLVYANKPGSQQFILENKDRGLICSLAKDGQVYHHFILPAKLADNLLATFHQLSTSLPNDLYTNQQIKISRGQQVYNCRISVLPSEGENNKIVMTVEEDKPSIKRLSALGLSSQDLKTIATNLKLKSGLILIAAPARQGKSTTYYSLLQDLTKNNKIIYSLESFPSKSLPLVQTIKMQKNKSLADYLRKIERADADIIGIDQLENLFDLNTALKQAARGRLIIATIEAKGAVAALKLALNSNLKPQAVAAGLRLIISQRILNKNCPRCLQKVKLESAWQKNLAKHSGLDVKNLKIIAAGAGCKFCNFQGRLGQLACFELMTILPEATLAPGFKPILQDALDKAASGVFAPEEISKLLI